MPIRKRKPVELRPAINDAMKRRHPEFGYHKNYIHPWSLFQKGCALQYRKLTDKQRHHLKMIQKVPEKPFNLKQLYTGPLQIKQKTPEKTVNMNTPLRIKWKTPQNVPNIDNIVRKLLKEKFKKSVVRDVARKMIQSGRPSSNFVKSSGRLKK